MRIAVFISEFLLFSLSFLVEGRWGGDGGVVHRTAPFVVYLYSFSTKLVIVFFFMFIDNEIFLLYDAL